MAGLLAGMFVCVCNMVCTDVYQSDDYSRLFTKDVTQFRMGSPESVCRRRQRVDQVKVPLDQLTSPECSLFCNI